MYRARCLLGCLLLYSRAHLALLLAFVLTSPALAQDAPTTANPRDFGLDLAPGIIAPGENQAVTTTDDDSQPVVGRIHVRVGAGAIILLPNGELVARREGQFTPTDRKFEPLDKDKFAARLAAEFPGFKTKTSNHYIYVYDSSDEFQFGTGRILETMLPGVKNWADGCHIDVKNPSLPLVVVMFRSENQFQKYRRMPPGVVAYYDPVSNRVFVYEQSRLAQVRPDLALGQAISTIAHEGVHQILHNIGVQQRLSVWPMWLSEGLAEFFAPTTMGAKLKWKGAGQINDLRMYELEQYVRGNSAADNNGELVEHTVLAGRLTSTGYAAAWALIHYLNKYKRPELLSLVRESSQIGPLTGATDITALGVVRENRDAFVAKIGDNFKDLESRLIAHLKKQPYTDPFLDAPHFVATFVSSSGRKSQKTANTFHSLPLASKWVGDMREKLPDTDRPSAQATIRQFPNRPQADAFARQFLAQ
ncbi:MAG TPA: DUF1570 domain-containing protein [Pirellulaceae bacterium]|jgi:hypothetical protein